MLLGMNTNESSCAPPPKMPGPLKWHGGKRYVAEHVLRLMPRHLNYVEPFAGGLQVLFARDPADPRYWWTDAGGRLWKGVNEIVGDLNGDLANFYGVLRDRDAFPEFARLAGLTLFDEGTWRQAKALLDGGGGGHVTRAWALFVCCRLSLAGRMGAFTGMTKVRLRGGRGNEVNAWLSAVEGLPEIHERLQGVQVLCRDAVKVIRDYDVPGTLLYLDPPYLPETRAAKKVYGPHEMTEAQHRHLLGVLLGVRHAKAILSGYASPLYETALARWRREEVRLPNHSAGGKKKRRMTEVLWCNF
jgi:DNA adenine methylase